MDVPIIDLQQWSNGHRDELAAALDEACRSVGFIQVVGHGIEPRVIDEMLAAADEFFSRPLASKLMAVPPPTLPSATGPAVAPSRAAVTCSGFT